MDQSPDLQTDALTAAGCERLFVDKASGKLARRPELDRLLEVLLAGDTVVVWRLDRLGRSIRDLIEVVTGLGERGVGFRSLAEAIDTTTANGRLTFHLFAALAEFEHSLIVERTHAGLAAARARGRPPVMTPDRIHIARQMYDAVDTDGRAQHTVDTIAKTIGVSRATIYKHLDGKQRRLA